ncbi:putative F-box domain-containing protein [Medicago truncatula]|uniref:Putative F-box domain-containing protein n=1 Tax=Medicago truncatula TaxID=3880 RepID=A0A396HBR2_MEDTR|nr:F-box/kelch-repeat protein At3g23880 [Medicago truncatula]RHN50770.1 putative F-box domain-containing protein [Medicago truncatula]
MSPSSLQTLHFDLITEIICRLPVKSLMKFKCVCKPWNALISADRKFARKHLRCMSSTMNHSLIQQSENNPSDFSIYPLRTFFTSCTTIDATEITFPLHGENYFDDRISIVAFCDGIFCLTVGPYRESIAVLWNPSIRKYNILPPLEENQRFRDTYVHTVYGYTVYGFGYDNIRDNYKVVAVTFYNCNSSGIFKTQTQVKVHTFGTTSWRLIDEFPSGSFGEFSVRPGKFVSGTINWLVFKHNSTLCSIVSLDLGTESYQEILQPDYGEETVERIRTLGVLRDCLSLISGQDIWLMKEYGNRNSWTKFATVPQGSSFNREILYTTEDDEVLLEIIMHLSRSKLMVYDSTNDTLKSLDIKTNGNGRLSIYVESLISPCS